MHTGNLEMQSCDRENDHCCLKSMLLHFSKGLASSPLLPIIPDRGNRALYAETDTALDRLEP
jgi:hypothetical protein